MVETSEKFKIRKGKGYLSIISYCGDGYYLTSSKIQEPKDHEFYSEFIRKVEDGLRIDDLFDDMQGKKIKVTVELIDE